MSKRLLPGRLATVTVTVLSLALAPSVGCGQQPPTGQGLAAALGAPQAGGAGSGADKSTNRAQAVLAAPTALFEILPPDAAPGAPPSRLFGSILFGSRPFNLSGPVLAALKEAQTVVTEAPADPPGGEGGQGVELPDLKRIINLDDPNTLRNDLGDETGELVEKIKSILEQSDESRLLAQAGMIDRMHAFMVVGGFQPSTPRGMTRERGSAAAAAKKAAQLGKPVVSLQPGLEAFERHAALSPKAAQELARLIAQDWAQLEAGSKAMAKAYEKGDYAASRKLLDLGIARMAAAGPEAAEYIESYKSRALHRDWADKIEAQARGQSIFAIVDQSHLTGENGLIALLLADGWTVRPVLDERDAQGGGKNGKH